VKKITFFITSFNEEKTIEKSIRVILSLKFKNKEIIIIDNGSKDKTQEIIKKFTNYKNVKIILRSKNLGYGASVKKAIKMSKSKYMYIHFSDLEYDHKTSIKMFALAEKNNFDAIFGSRLKKMNFKQKFKAIKTKPAFVATIIFTTLYNLFYKKKFTDVIGSKFYKVSSLKKIINTNENYFNFDFILKNRLISGDFKIGEVYTKYWPRKNNEEKNVKFYHMFPGIYQILKFKFLIFLKKL
jgi:glycosyltransferase involved in cell wall biosynthesis